MGLRIWNLPTDPYDSQQLADNLAKIDQHDHTFGKGALIGTPAIEDGAITADKLAPGAIPIFTIPNNSITPDQITFGDKLALNDTTHARRGALSIATTQSTSSTTYTTLTTPDQIPNVILPANGLIAVAYQATWQESVTGGARAAIFIGANQLMTNLGVNPHLSAGAKQIGASTNIDTMLVSTPWGLAGTPGSGSTGDVTTGQTIGSNTNVTVYSELDGTVIGLAGAGGICYIFAAAGTYTISVKYKASSGSVTAKNRRLWVWSFGF